MKLSDFLNIESVSRVVAVTGDNTDTIVNGKITVETDIGKMSIDTGFLDKTILRINAIPEYALDKSKLEPINHVTPGYSLCFNSGYILFGEPNKDKIQRRNVAPDAIFQTSYYPPAKDLAIVAFGESQDAILVTKYFGKVDYKSGSILKEYKCKLKANVKYKGFNFCLISHLVKRTFDNGDVVSVLL